jgi:signal transduction histidine kinase/CheY-like chemotaxis protein
VPLLAGQSVLGVLTLSRHEPGFTETEVRLASSIADLAALALRSAHLFEERSRAYGELAAAQDHLVRTEKLRALGEMASGVAHDFNNLLAAILGRTQLLLRRMEDPRLRQWLQVIERSALDGAQTVRRLQEFARVRRDQPLVPVDLNEVVRDAVEMTQSRWHEDCLRRGVVIEVRTHLGAISLIAGDPAELREAMTNLILNAVDAMPSGGALTFTSALVDDQVEVTVSDSGMGIPEAIRDNIFDPFFTTKGPQGTGLGLSMTYGILSRHRAQITVESEEGQGSTFRLRFPALATRPTAATSGTEAAPDPQALRCLVVDDEESVGAVIGDVLEALGHHAVVLTDGAAAIERLRDERFDAVFTDLAMPGVSGWQVARAVKDRSPEVPVFVVTGFGVELSPEERRAHGVTAIFSKPLNIEDLVSAVARIVRAEHGQREVR